MKSQQPLSTQVSKRLSLTAQIKYTRSEPRTVQRFTSSKLPNLVREIRQVYSSTRRAAGAHPAEAEVRCSCERLECGSRCLQWNMWTN